MYCKTTKFLNEIKSTKVQTLGAIRMHGTANCWVALTRSLPRKARGESDTFFPLQSMWTCLSHSQAGHALPTFFAYAKFCPRRSFSGLTCLIFSYTLSFSLVWKDMVTTFTHFLPTCTAVLHCWHTFVGGMLTQKSPISHQSYDKMAAKSHTSPKWLPITQVVSSLCRHAPQIDTPFVTLCTRLCFLRMLFHVENVCTIATHKSSIQFCNQVLINK